MDNNTTEFFRNALSSNDFYLLSEEDTNEIGHASETVRDVLQAILIKHPNPELSDFLTQFTKITGAYVNVATNLLQDSESSDD